MTTKRTPLDVIDGAFRVIQSQSKTSGDGADHQADAIKKARIDVGRLVEVARLCADGIGDLSDLRAALAVFED